MRGPLPYIGGKNRLANRIVALFPEHTTYVEPFAGGAQVFFRKEPSKVEVLKDLSRDVVNFFHVCQQHYEELVRYLKFMVVSREWFEQLMETKPESLTDIQRAARFLYLAKTCYAGLVRRQSYAWSVTQKNRFNSDRIPQQIQEVHKRLARTDRVFGRNSRLKRCAMRTDRHEDSAEWVASNLWLDENQYHPDQNRLSTTQNNRSKIATRWSDVSASRPQAVVEGLGFPRADHTENERVGLPVRTEVSA
jgi:D12 class N6 adenine-specific DNA methyltransferase